VICISCKVRNTVKYNHYATETYHVPETGKFTGLEGFAKVEKQCKKNDRWLSM